MNIYKIFRPLIFLLSAEKAHHLAINFLRFCPRTISLFSYHKEYDTLKSSYVGLDFKNPVGMAAGFDKNAEIFDSLAKFGFGFVEVGTVTPKAQAGNPKPRIFRLKQDRAIINRLGFNNLGADYFADNIAKRSNKDIVLGINVGKNKDTQDAISDYVELINRFYEEANYMVINISSPNTKNLRDIQNKENLDQFLQEIMSLKAKLQEKTNKNTPILLKIAPDLDEKSQKDICQVILKNKIDGIIISNTTIDRELNLRDHNQKEEGGLSGKPLFEKSNAVLRNIYQYTNREIPIIAVGGISNAYDAYEKIKNGATLVQIYSAFIYEGFSLVEKIKKDLHDLVIADGYQNISEAIGTNLT